MIVELVQIGGLLVLHLHKVRRLAAVARLHQQENFKRMSCEDYLVLLYIFANVYIVSVKVFSNDYEEFRRIKPVDIDLYELVIRRAFVFNSSLNLIMAKF